MVTKSQPPPAFLVNCGNKFSVLTVFAILPILCTMRFRNGSHHMISRKTSTDSFGHLQSVGNVEEQYKDDSGGEHDAAGIEPDNVKVHLDGLKGTNRGCK